MRFSRTFKATLAIAVFSLSIAPASAQIKNRSSMSDRLNRLESAVQDLQGVVYSVEENAFGQGQAGSDPFGDGVDYGGDPAVRLNQLEAELQNLTGRIEEIAYRMDQNSRRLDSMASVLAMSGSLPAGEAQGMGPVGSALPGAGGEDPNSLNAQYRNLQEQQRQPQPAAPATGGPVDLSGTGAFTGTLEQQEDAVANFDCAAALPDSPDAIYDAAFDALLSGEYDDSECAFNKFLENFGDDPRAADAQFRLGEIYLATGANVDAAKAFLNHIRTWPNDGRAQESYLKLGVAYAKLGKTTEACKIFSGIEQKFKNLSPAMRQRIAVERGVAGC